MLNIERKEKLKELGFYLILQIHDELILEGPKENVKEAMEIVRECMEKPWPNMANHVKFQTDIKSADCWSDAK